MSSKYEPGRLRIVCLLTKGGFTGNKHLETHFVRTDTVVTITEQKLDTSKDDEQKNVPKGRGGTGRLPSSKDTYSTYLFHGGVSDCAMKTQLVKIVHMINILNNVKKQIKENKA